VHIADKIIIPYASPKGKLEELIKNLRYNEKKKIAVF